MPADLLDPPGSIVKEEYREQEVADFCSPEQNDQITMDIICTVVIVVTYY